MLNAMNKHDALVVEDLVDDPEVPPSRRVEPLELASQRFACGVRVVCDRSEDRFQRRATDLAGQSIEMSQALGRALDLEDHS